LNGTKAKEKSAEQRRGLETFITRQFVREEEGEKLSHMTAGLEWGLMGDSVMFSGHFSGKEGKCLRNFRVDLLN
jgi:hypothetical protein